MKIIQGIENIVATFNWQEFQFLRPQAFYGFIPLALIVILPIAATKRSKKLAKYLVKPLRRHMERKQIW